MKHPGHDLSKVILALGYEVELLVLVDALDLSAQASALTFGAIAAPMLGIYAVADRIFPAGRGNFARGDIFPWWHHRIAAAPVHATAHPAYYERAAA